MKIYDDLNHVKSMVLLHTYLFSKKLHVPKIIISYNGEKYIKLSNKSYAVLYSFLNGKQFSWNKESNEMNDANIKKVANMLSYFHSLTIGENEFNLPDLSFETKNSIERLSVLHFDLTKNNIFITKDKAGLIDFDDAKYGPSVCDLAIAISILFFSKTNGADIVGAKKFVDAYYCDKSELKKKELPHIKPLALKWVDYILDNNEFDSSTTESFVIRRELIDKYFSLIK